MVELSTLNTAVLPACRVAIEVSEDDSSDAGSVDSSISLSSYRSQLLLELSAIFSPLPLRMLCRNVIRTALLAFNPSGRVKEVIKTLPVPTSTKDFLAFINVPTTDSLRHPCGPEYV